jgi:hypothetical protein
MVSVGYPSKQEATFRKFLYLLNVSSLAEARHVLSSQLIAANSALIASSRYSAVELGPVPDGIFITENQTPCSSMDF